MAEFLVGEALLGTGDEVAHIDLIIGSRDGPVGNAFGQGLTNQSIGHTPLLAVIKPNLPSKPFVLIVPKVTIKKSEQIGLIFGAAQQAVAKAMADAVEEGIIPKNKVDAWVAIAGVFVGPNAKDERRIYMYNYGAMKLAIRRALSNYPSLEKIQEEKDRSRHPIMGGRFKTLWNPPYLQVALDTGTLKAASSVVEKLPPSERIIIEIGTPLLKEFGIRKAIDDLRKHAPYQYLVADAKTLDVGRAEVNAVADATANAIVISGNAPLQTLKEGIREACKRGIHVYLDTLGSDSNELVTKVKELETKPDVVVVHRGIDEEAAGEAHQWEEVGLFKDLGCLVAVAGGILPGKPAQKALKANADILIVGRYIYQSYDPKYAAERFLQDFPPDADTMRLFDRIDY